MDVLILLYNFYSTPSFFSIKIYLLKSISFVYNKSLLKQIYSRIMTKNISDADFEKQVLKSDMPVLVDFWAEWCGPCKSLAPILEEVSKELEGTVEITKINIDDNPQTPTQHTIKSLPTMVLFKDSKEIGRKIGVLPQISIINWINELIKG